MIKNGVKCVPKSDKKSEELPRKQFFRVDALAKHVEKDDSAKCGLIDSMGRRQKTIIIESGICVLFLLNYTALQSKNDNRLQLAKKIPSLLRGVWETS